MFSVRTLGLSLAALGAGALLGACDFDSTGGEEARFVEVCEKNGNSEEECACARGVFEDRLDGEDYEAALAFFVISEEKGADAAIADLRERGYSTVDAMALGVKVARAGITMADQCGIV